MAPPASGCSANLQRTLHRIAHEIIEANADLGSVACWHSHRGVSLAQRLRRLIDEFSGAEVDLGTVDIIRDRDDGYVRRAAKAAPRPGAVDQLDFPLQGRRTASSSVTSCT